MAVARAQGPGGLTAIHYWLIVFVALWLTATVLLVILYLDQSDMQKTEQDLRADISKIISNSGRRLPVMRAAKTGDGSTMVDLIEKERSQAATMATGNPEDDASAIRKALTSKLEVLRGNPLVGTPEIFGVDSYAAALDALWDVYQTKAESLAAAQDGVAQVQAELESVRAAQARQKQDFDEQAQAIQTRLAKIEAEYGEFRQGRNQEIDDFEAQVEQVKQQCAEDIQEQRAQIVRLRTEYDDLFARYGELKRKLGQAAVKPVPLATARGADGVILDAPVGQDIVYIGLGARDQLTLGLEFAVYDALAGIPEDGQAKARIEVVKIFENTAMCQIKAKLPLATLQVNDLIANPVYDRNVTLKFYVLGEFDLNGDGRVDGDGSARIVDRIRDWGGEVQPTLSELVDFVVLGAPPSRPVRRTDRGFNDDRRLEQAKRAIADYRDQRQRIEALAIPTLTQSVFLTFLGRDGGQLGD